MNGPVFLMLAGAVGFVFITIIVSAVSTTKASSRQAEQQAAARERTRLAADSARARDSATVLRLVHSPRRDSLAWADSRIHQLGLAVEHATLHRSAVDAVLDSASKMVRREGVFPTAPIRQALEGLKEPITTEQRQRRTRLLATITASEARLQREARRVAERATTAARAQFAREMESRLLDDGLDARVTVSGPNNTTLRLRYILVSRVWAHKFSQDGNMIANLRRLGFKKFVITDGYDETWYWNL
jgi:hypothetical protein